MLEKAEEQIARLVVAPADITITVRPTIFGRMTRSSCPAR